MSLKPVTTTPEAAPAQGRPLTGKHVLMIAIAFFGIIIAVNVYMMSQAIGGFPGLVEQHPYTASQEFDRKRAAQIALGWKVEVSTEENVLHAAFADAEGRPLEGLDVQAIVGRPATLADDREVALLPSATRPGVYELRAPLDLGMWRVEITALNAAGDRHHVTTEFRIR